MEMDTGTQEKNKKHFTQKTINDEGWREWGHIHWNEGDYRTKDQGYIVHSMVLVWQGTDFRFTDSPKELDSKRWINKQVAGKSKMLGNDIERASYAFC